MKKVLIVAYHFPPVGGLGAAGAQRVVKFCRHLPATGWEPCVLTVRESCYDSWLTLDEASLEQVPDSVKVVRTGMFRVLGPLLSLKRRLRPLVRRGEAGEGAVDSNNAERPPEGPKSRYQRVKDAFTDLFELPDEVAGWLVPAIVAGVRAVRRDKIDVIFATGRPWTSLVIGMAIKTIARKPLVLDFRDPWMTNPFRLRYSGFKERVEGWLEARVVRSADVIVANTDHLRDEFIERFGASVADKCLTVTNGFDADEFSRLVAANEARMPGDARPSGDTFVLTHTGFLYGKRDPRGLLDAIRLLKDSGKVQPGELVCKLVGGAGLEYDLPGLLKEYGIEPFVHLHGQVPYAESIAELAASDAALLLQPGTYTQIPSKLFEYIGLGKRIVTIAPESSAVAKLVRENDLGRIADPDDPDAIARALLETLQDWKSSGAGRSVSPEVHARFEIRECTKRLAFRLDRLVPAVEAGADACSP